MQYIITIVHRVQGMLYSVVYVVCFDIWTACVE